MSSKIKEGMFIRICGAKEVGIDTFQSQSGKIYKNTLILCDADDICISESNLGNKEKEQSPKDSPFEELVTDDYELPF